MKTYNYLALLFFVLCTSSTATTATKGESTERKVSTPVLTALTLSSAGSAILWALNQHRYSKIAHDRYPLMQAKNILSARLDKESEPAARATIEQELEGIKLKLKIINSRKNSYNIARSLFAVLGILLAGGTIWGMHKKASSKD